MPSAKLPRVMWTLLQIYINGCLRTSTCFFFSMGPDQIGYSMICCGASGHKVAKLTLWHNLYVWKNNNEYIIDMLVSPLQLGLSKDEHSALPQEPQFDAELCKAEKVINNHIIQYLKHRTWYNGSYLDSNVIIGLIFF